MRRMGGGVYIAFCSVTVPSCSGVGGLVVNHKEQVLVVQERFSFGGKRHWKLPGGHVEMG